MSSHLDYFTDREAAIAAFDHLWEHETPWILAYTGLSGNGKSTLLEWLEANRCRRDRQLYALFGLEAALSVNSALHALLEAPAVQAALPRATWETYCARRRAALERQNARTVALNLHQTMSGSPDGQQTMTVGLAEALRAIERQTAEELEDAWLEGLSALPAAGRPVFLLDNYDAFQERNGLEELQRFWQLLARARHCCSGLRVILASREPVRHVNAIRPLETGLTDAALELLMPEDSDRLLRALGVSDPAFRQAVYARLAGGHPLLTRIAAEAWHATPGGLPAAQVPQLHGHEAAAEWLQGRIIDRLAEPLKSAVRWAVLLPRFNAESLTAILDLPRPLTADEFRALTGYAFIRRVPDGWAGHDLVRRVQAVYLQRERPGALRDFHTRARDYFLARDESLLALYHHFFIASEEAFALWQELEAQAAFHFDHERWAALTTLAQAPELPLAPAQQAEVVYRAGRRHYYRAEMDAALDSYRQALALFRAVGDRLGEANVLQSLGDVQRFRAEMDAALDSYRQALALFRAVGSRLGEANVLLPLGSLEYEAENIDKATALLSQALELYRLIGDRYSQARALYRLGDCARQQGNGEQARACYQEASALWLAIGLADLVAQIIAPRLEQLQGGGPASKEPGL